jgi:hypothetical protein
MDNDTSIPASRKKPAMALVILLGIHGLFLIILGLIAFFGGFIGAYDVSHGRTTPGDMVAVLGAFVAWLFLLGGIISLLCALGLWMRQRWGFWLTIALEVTNLILAGCIVKWQLFAPWSIILSMGFAGVILLYVLIGIDPHMLSGK